MAAISSAASGPWSSASTWAGGVAPTSADTVTVLNGHTVTLDTTGLACLSGTVNSGGAVALSTSANSGLTSRQNFTFLSGSSCNFDLSAVPAIYSTIVTNGLANGTTRYGVVFNDGVTSIVCKGAPRKRVARLANAVTAGQVTFDVNDASGWRVGDVICVATTDAGYTWARSEDRTVSDISGNTVTVSAGLTYGHQAGGYVGNMSSNLTFTSANSTGDSRTGYVQSNTSSAASPAASRLFQDVCFEKLGSNIVAPRIGSLELAVGGYPTSAYVGKGVQNCAFKDCFGNSLGASASTDGTAVAFDIDNNVATAIQITGGGCNFNFSGGGLYMTNPVYRAHVLRGFGNIHALAGVAYGDTVFVDPVICGVNIPVGTPMTIRGGSIFACGNFAYTAKDIELYNVNLGTEFGANNGTVFAQRYSGRYAAYSCNFQSGGSLFANSSGAAVQKSSQVYLYDKNGDTAIQEVYSRQSLTVPIMQKATDQVANALNSLKCSSSSTINDEIIHTFPLLVSAGVAQTLFVNVRKNSVYGAATLPFISATKDGAVLATATMSAGTPADTWERLALTFTSPTSGQATITLQSQSANNGAVAWFSGIPIYPFISNVRHYGYVFDETNAVRVANSVTVAPEATAIAYTGVTINTVTPQISVGAGTANTFQKVYDHIQAWAVQNIDKPVLLTSTDGNNFAVPLTCKVVWPSMGTDGTLAGGWLQLAAPGTHTYKLSGTKIEFQAAGAYNMSGTQFGGTVELVNTSGGAVTVSAPSGTSYTNTGPGITVTAPTSNQSVTVNGLEPGSRIQIYDLSSDTELYNGVVAGSSHTWSDPSTPVAPRTIRLRAAWASGTVAKQFVDTGIGTCGTGVGDAAVTYLINQQADAIYGANAVDGSTVTGITIVDAVDRMQINIAGGAVSWKAIYAYNVHWLTTEEGIRDDGSIITAKDVANYTLALFKIKNTSATPLQITGGYGVDSVTGSVADILDVTGGSIFPVVDHVVSSVVTVSGGNVVTGTAADIIAALPSAVANATAVRTELGTELARLDVAVSTRSATTPPTEAEIVTAMEASTVLAKEATVASRLGASSYQAAPSAASVASAVLAAAAAAPIAANVESINGTGITGGGVPGNEWGPA